MRYPSSSPEVACSREGLPDAMTTFISSRSPGQIGGPTLAATATKMDQSHA